MSGSGLSARRAGSRFLLFVLLISLLAACADLSAPTPVPKRTPIPGVAQATPKPARPKADRDEQTWLIMMYEDADDEILEEDMYNDLNEAEMVGSTERVTVVAQMDRYDGGFDGDGDWTTTKRFLVEQDNDLEKLNSKELADLGEVNMADADTLIDFVTWAAKTYPADNYVLILSNHGAGWPGGWNDAEPSTRGRNDISLVDSFGDMLYLMEMDEALAHIMAETDIGEFELIGFDACLMSSLEVYTAVAPYARYSVASQEVEPTLGWAYAAMLGRLTDSPEIGGEELAAAIVDSYIEQDQQILDDTARAKYVARNYDYEDDTTAEEVVAEEIKSVTLTSVNLDALADVNAALNSLVLILAEDEQKPVALARRYAQAFESVFDEEHPSPFIDLGHFALLLKDKIDDPQIDAAADALLAAIDRAVTDEKHGEEKAGATGISIHFPNSKLYKDSDAGAESYATVASRFASESLWDDYLAFHYAKKPMPSSVAAAPTAAVPTPEAVVEDEAPGAAVITIDPVTASADTFTRQEPVLLSSRVQGAEVAFIYIFIGRIDGRNGDIRIADIDFLDSEQTKQVGGAFYPDWGAQNIEIEFEWDGTLFALDDGQTSALAMLSPEDYGATPEDAVYSVDGLYTTAKGKKSRRAKLLMRNGELVQVLGYTGTGDSGAMREVTPKDGDTFQILEQWIRNTPEDEVEFYTKEGRTLTFGEEDFIWQIQNATKGDYVVGFIAEDFDGNKYEEYVAVTLE